jgi:ABC-2 type transport system permease protein/sodium transport system permease protein
MKGNWVNADREPHASSADDADSAPAPATATGLPSATRRGITGRLVRLCIKELRETLRDRRTVVTLVLMPLLVYPLLSILFNRLLMVSAPMASAEKCIVALATEAEAHELREFFQLGDAVLRQRNTSNAPETTAGEGQAEGTAEVAEPTIEWYVASDLEAELAAGRIDVAVSVAARKPDPDHPNRERRLRAEIVHRQNSKLGEWGAQHIEKRLQAVNEQYLLERLNIAGIQARPPARFERRVIPSTASTVSLTTLVPLILILMTITGAVYPAIDLTAGERERGTLETLMAAPVPRLGLLTAKYVAVVVVALLTAVANLTAMCVTVVSTGLGVVVFGPSGLTAVLVVQVLGLLVLFAAFFSAILLAVTSFARSFKEAQAYLIPLMLLALAPGMLSLMPQLRFNGLLSVTPLVNIVLLARDLMEGRVDFSLTLAAVLSTALYALAAIAMAARIFGSDAILYGSEASWTDLLRTSRQRGKPTVSGAMLSLALIFPLYFLTANFLARMETLSATGKLFLSATATAILFAGVPLLIARARNAPLRSTFRLRPASLLAFAAAGLLGISLWPLAHEVFLLNQYLGWTSLDEDRLQGVQQLLDSWREISPAVILFALALTPAVCEEFFFRGYLFSALRHRFSPVGTILLTAVLFGVFHVVVTSMLSIERLLPSSFLGIVLGWVCLRTGSSLPGMLLHALHNGLLLTIIYYRDELLARGWGVEEQSHMPAGWLIASALGVVIGLTVMAMATHGARSD